MKARKRKQSVSDYWMARVTIAIPEERLMDVDSVCECQGLNRSEFFRQLLENYFAGGDQDGFESDDQPVAV